MPAWDRFAPGSAMENAALNVETRMRSPLRIRASNKAADFSIDDQALPQQVSIDDTGRGLCMCR